MSETQSTVDDSLPQSVLEQVDAVCDRFENAWLAGQRPRIEEYLADVSDERVRQALVKELIALDIYHRQKHAAETERYRLGEQIGVGGMGEVRRGRDLRLNRELAIKVLREDHQGQGHLQRRFLEEARIGGRLQHPGIVPVHDLGELSDGRPFFTMKLVEGRTLAALLDERTEPSHDWPRFLTIFEQICQTLAYAHAQGVIHRDLKPGNVMVGAFGEVQVMDWGLAKVLKRTSTEDAAALGETAVYGPVAEDTSESMRTRPGQAMGTFAYMPPEQARGEIDRVDERSDVFGLGAILCEILTGRPPFTGRDISEIFAKAKACAHAETLARLDACGADGELLHLAKTCQAAKAEDRPRNAGVVAESMKSYLAGVQERLRTAERERAAAQARAEEAKKTAAAEQARAEEARKTAAAEQAQAEEARKAATAERRTRRRTMWAAFVVLAIAATAFAIIMHSRDQAVEAKNNAQQEALGKGVALRKEAAARSRAERLLLRSDTHAYISTIKLAQREWENTSIGRAQKALAECAEGFRHWEHAYLTRLCEGSERTLVGHQYRVVGVAISPDGTQLISVGGQGYLLGAPGPGEVKVWDEKTGRELATLDLGPDMVFSSVAFRPDGKRLAVGYGERADPGEVKIWDVPQRRVIHTLHAHKGSVLAVAFSPDGRRLATAGLDQTIRIWKVESGEDERTLVGHTGPVFGLGFSPDGEHIATGGIDSTIKIWNVRTGREQRTFKGHTQAIFRLRYSPDGKWLASSTFHPSGSGTPGEVKVWDCRKGELKYSLTGHADAVLGLAFSPDGRMIATASFDETVRLWDAKSGQGGSVLKGHAGPVNCLAFSPDGHRLISGSDDKTVKVWDMAAPPGIRLLQGHQGWVNSLAFSSDGRSLLTGSQDKSLKLWDMHTGKELLTFKGHGGDVHSVAFSPDGQHVASGDERGTVKVWDRGTGREIWSLQANPGWVQGLSFSADGNLLVSAGHHEARLRVWEVQNGREVFSPAGHAGGVNSVVFRPDGRLIASGGNDGVVRVWDVASKQVRHVLEGHRHPVHSVAFSRDGKWLASGSGTLQEPGEIKVWDTESGQEVYSLKGHTSHVLGVSFSSDGKRLASVSQYGKMNGIFGEIKLWDMATGLETLTLSGLGMPEVAIAFSPDGQRLATAGWNRLVTVWDASSH